MKRLFMAGQTFFKEHRGKAGTLMAFLLILLLAGAFLGAVHGRAAQIPENPIKKEETASLVRLAGTGEVLADNFQGTAAPFGADRTEESADTDEAGTEALQREETEQSLQENDSGEQETGWQRETENPSSGRDPGNGNGNSGAASGNGTDSTLPEEGGRAGGNDASGSPVKNPGIGEQKQDKTVTPGGKKDREYFRTTIKNGETVSQAEYPYEIEQLTECEVVRIRNTVNDGKASAYRGVVTLARGENRILVSVAYREADGSSFTVSKEYTVIYEPEQLVIRTDLNDRTVKRETISFQAYAQLGQEDFPLEVTVGGKAAAATDNYFYENIPLQVGENIIVLTAERDGKQASETFTVIYEEPQETGIRIDTDLSDQTVRKKKFGFYVQAFRGSEPVENVEVLMNGNTVPPTGDSQYEVLLEEGENEFQVTAADGSTVQTEVYTVTYVKQVQGEDDGEGNAEAPSVTCTLGASGSNLTTESSVLSFQVQAVDYKGNGLGASAISITCFGDEGDHPVSLIWENLGDVSYKVTLSPGNNTLLIYVTDDEDNTTQLTYSYFCEATASGEPIGTARISVEATTVGSGVLLSADVPIYEGEPASQLLQRLLEDNGYTCEYTGTPESGFYLGRIRASAPFVSGKIPDDLLQKLNENGIEVYMDGFDRQSLGDFDFTHQSGWMYQVNGVYPNYSFSDCYLQDGDVMRIRFTLAYGSDIGGSSVMGNGSNEGDGSEWGYEW